MASSAAWFPCKLEPCSIPTQFLTVKIQSHGGNLTPMGKQVLFGLGTLRLGRF